MKKIFWIVFLLAPLLSFGQIIKQKQVLGLENRLDSIHTMGGGITPLSPGQWVLEIDHDETKSSNVVIYDAIEINREYYKCFGHIMQKAGDSCEYWSSPGYGGEHVPALFGLSGSLTGGRFLTAGNMWFNGSNVVGLTSQDTIFKGEWTSIGYSYDGAYVATYVDGLTSSRFPYTGKRSVLSEPGSTSWYLGGSDHSKAKGRMAEAVFYETGSVTPPVTSSAPYMAKMVQSNYANPMVYFRFDIPTATIINYGGGDAGHKMNGILNSGASYNGFQNSGSQLPNYWPQYKWDTVQQSPYTGGASTPPSGSPLAYDKFHRANSTPQFTLSGSPSLGSTEGGSAGIQAWTLVSGGNNYAGIRNKWAYFSSTNVAHINVGSANDSIIVRKATDKSEKDLIVQGRRADDNNYLEFYVNAGYGYLRQIVAGTPTGIGDFAMPADWNTITLVTNSSNKAQVYIDATKKLSNIDISGGSTTATRIGMGAGNSYVRISEIIVYPSL